MTTLTKPRAYFACLASYNAGRLYGAWIDCAQDADSIRADIATMLANSPLSGAEEWAIHDYDEMPASLGEWPDLDKLAAVGAAVAEHGYDLVNGAVDHGVCDVADVGEWIEENYRGEYEKFEDFVEETFRDCHEIPEHLEYYIDWESMARDWKISGDFMTVKMPNFNIAVFDNR